jgi:hypothetical protein
MRSSSSHSMGHPTPPGVDEIERPMPLCAHRHGAVPAPLSRAGRSRQFGRASAPMIQQRLQTMRGAECRHRHVIWPAVRAQDRPVVALPAAHVERPHAVGAHVAEGHWRPGLRSWSCAHAGEDIRASSATASSGRCALRYTVPDQDLKRLAGAAMGAILKV